MKEKLTLKQISKVTGGANKILFKTLIPPQYTNRHVNNKETFYEEDLKKLDEFFKEIHLKYQESDDCGKAVIRERIFHGFKDYGINMWEYKETLESFGLQFYQ